MFYRGTQLPRILKKYIPMQEGDIKTLDGKTVGTHSGVFYYTVGQRKGFGLGGAGNGEPWYVVKKDVENNILYVNQGECDLLFTKELTTRGFNFITKNPTRRSFGCLPVSVIVSPLKTQLR